VTLAPLPVVAAEFSGTLPPGSGWAALSVVALVIVSLAWYRQRFKKMQRQNILQRRALNSLDSAVLLADRQGHNVLSNQKWDLRIAGTSVVTVAGANAGLAGLKDIVFEEESNRQALQELEVAAAAQEEAEREIAVIDENGHKAWCNISVKPVGGDPPLCLWSLRDADVYDAVDKAIGTEQNLLTEFLDKFPIGFFSADEDGKFVQANESLAGWLGTTSENLIGKGKQIQDFTVSDARSNVVWSILPSGEATGCAEVRLVAEDGRQFDALVSQTIVTDGASLRTRALVRDLSGERDLVSALRSAEDRFQRLFDAAPVGIALLDTKGVVTDCSAVFAEMVGKTETEVEHNDLWQCASIDDRDRLRRWVTNALETDEIKPLQITLDGPDAMVAAIFGRRYQADDGGPGGLVVHAFDQTEQRSLEEQFIQSQKMDLVGQLAGGVAHDFNNLLTAMIGFCDLLLQRHSPKDQSFADIMQIKQNANRAANLVRQLLAFSRQQTLQPRILKITDVLAELSHLLRRLIGADIELDIVHGRDLWQVKVDESQMEQVIINLVVNARDVVEAGGKVSIKTRNLSRAENEDVRHQSLPKGDYVVLEVADTGTGIPKDIVDKIFEPFFTTKEVGSGTGLGLSTVYGIIRQTGGHIFVDSEVGEGTCFTIYLPQHIANADDVAVEEVAEEVSLSPQPDLTGAGTVMLVEDEDAVRMFGARALRNKGYTVVEAGSGDEALELLAQEGNNIDVLVTDVVMPGLDGPAMIRKVRETHADMKVVFISGYTEDSFRKRLDVAEDIHFLPKPFTLQQLASKVKEIMAEEA
tara:strand:+ start:58269 stop:60701 length:2433 start_codon:yes stop_codon:yes gene_type:complete